MTIQRRKFLTGLFAAPAIVAASSLMPLRGMSLIIQSDQIDMNEIITILEGRLEDGWHTLKYPGDAPLIRFDSYDTISLRPLRVVDRVVDPNSLNKWEASSAFPPAPRTWGSIP